MRAILRFSGGLQVHLAAKLREMEDAHAEVEALESTVAEQKALIARLEEDIVKVQLATRWWWGEREDGGGGRALWGCFIGSGGREMRI